MSYPIQTHNELSRRIITKCVNINSMFRETQAHTLWPQYKCMYDSKWSSSDFIIRLPTALDNVASMTLGSMEIPNTLYTFSSHLKTNVFTIVELKQEPSDNTSHIIEILPGNYDSKNIISQIQASIDIISDLSGRVLVNMHPNYGRVYMYSNDDFEFDLDFRLPDEKTRDIRMNMGWILGYRNPYYFYNDTNIDGCLYASDYITGETGITAKQKLNPTQYNSKFVKRNYASSMIAPAEAYKVAPAAEFDNVTLYSNYLNGFVSEGFMEIKGPRYLFLLVDDFNNNVNDQYMSLVSKNTLMPSSNILAKIGLTQSKNAVGYDDKSDLVPKKREFLGPVRIDKLHFKLVDEFGRVVNLNNNEISLLLEFEVIYNL